MIIKRLILAISASAFALTAQESVEHPKPTTKLEAFQSKTGTVIVRGFSTVGTIRGLGGTVTIDAREFRDASSPAIKTTGISITIKELSRIERENTSFIDYDEIDALIRGIDYIAKATKDITSLSNFEAEYRTKGDFRVVVFNDSNGGMSLALSSGRIGRTNAYLKLSDITEFRRLILDAKSKL